MMAKREPWVPLLCNYPDSVKVNRLSLGAESLYLRLIARCDDGCNFDGAAEMLAYKLFASRLANHTVSVTDTVRMRDELVTAGLVVLYRIEGEEYLHVLNCKKCSRRDVQPDQRYPDYSEDAVITEVGEIVTKPLRKRNESGTRTKRKRDARREENRREQNITTPVQSEKNIGSNGGADSDFLEFWENYPRKQGRKAALAVFRQMTCRPAMAFMVAAIKEQKKSAQWKKGGKNQYVPLAANWLDNQMWEDQLQPDGSDIDDQMKRLGVGT